MLDLTKNRYSSQWRADNAGDDIRRKLTHLVTEYDRQQEKKGKGYNPYGLAQYLEAADLVADEINKGMEKNQAIQKHFQGALASFLMRKI